MSQGAMEGGATHAQGWAVCRKEPWKAVRRMRSQGKKISNNFERSSVDNNLFIILSMHNCLL